MPGVFVALLFLGLGVAFGNPLEAAYLKATGVLLWWYVGWSIPIVFIALLVGLGVTAASGLAGLGFGRGTGALVGLGTGATASFFIVLRTFVQRGLFITGAYLLSTALTLQGPEAGYLWDTMKRDLGATLITVPILLNLISRAFPARSAVTAKSSG